MRMRVMGGRKGWRETQLGFESIVGWWENLVQWKFPGMYEGNPSEV